VAHVGKAETPAPAQRWDADGPTTRPDVPLMPFKANTFEGGTDGVAITTANSGGASGAPWDLVEVGAGDAVAEFDDAQASQGVLSARLATTATAALVQLRWSFDPIDECFTRFYLYLPSTVALPARVQLLETAAFTLVGRFLVVDVAGVPKLRLYTAADASNATGTVAVTRDAWIRIETWVRIGATGIIQAKLFNSPDISTPDDTITIDPYVAAETPIERVRYGWNTNVANAEYWLDSIAMDTSGYMGPYSVPGESSTRRAIVA
jgi:hypothetical protein